MDAAQLQLIAYINGITDITLLTIKGRVIKHNVRAISFINTLVRFDDNQGAEVLSAAILNDIPFSLDTVDIIYDKMAKMANAAQKQLQTV